MSSYENYNDVCQVYDSNRITIGVEEEAALIQFHSGKPLKELHVLDAGCGTGNYADAFLKYGLGKLTLLDASPGMLEKARAKPNIAAGLMDGRVDSVVEATMPAMPFKDGTFDVVLLNVVLHHLVTTSDGTNFAEIEAVLEEVHRVMRPNGLVAILTVLPSSFAGFWYASLIPSATDRHRRLFPTMQQNEQIFQNTNFLCLNKINLFTRFQGENHYDCEGPLKKEWRSTVSFFSGCTAAEIEEMERKVRALKEAGTLVDYMHAHDKQDELGSSTLYVCRAL